MWKTITNEEYHSEYRNYLSSSDMRRILRSPAHYRVPSAPATQAQEIGTLAHVAVLEPDTWQACYQPSPKIDRRTKEGKALADWQAAQEAQRGIRYIQEDVYSQIEAIASSVHASVGSAGLLAGGVAELSGFTEIAGQPVRIRPDYLKDDMIIDLKTTHDCRDFQRSLFQWGYDIQASLYESACMQIDGKSRRFIWIVVEKDPPYGCMIFEASDDVLNRGQKQYLKAIEIYQSCAAIDYWPAYNTEIMKITVPKWLKELE